MNSPSAAAGAELSVNAGGAAFIMFWPNCWAAVEAEWRRAIALMHSVGRSTCGREERVMSGRCGRGAFTLPGFEHRRASDRLRRAALCEAVEPSIRVDDDGDEAVKQLLQRRVLPRGAGERLLELLLRLHHRRVVLLRESLALGLRPLLDLTRHHLRLRELSLRARGGGGRGLSARAAGRRAEGRAAGGGVPASARSPPRASPPSR